MLKDVKYALGIETENGPKVLKTPRRKSLVPLQEGIRFKTFSKRTTAKKWMDKIIEKNIPVFENIQIMIVPKEWGVNKKDDEDIPVISDSEET